MSSPSNSIVVFHSYVKSPDSRSMKASISRISHGHVWLLGTNPIFAGWASPTRLAGTKLWEAYVGTRNLSWSKRGIFWVFISRVGFKNQYLYIHIYIYVCVILATWFSAIQIDTLTVYHQAFGLGFNYWYLVTSPWSVIPRQFLETMMFSTMKWDAFTVWFIVFLYQIYPTCS